jgi:hypothetical protein
MAVHFERPVFFEGAVVQGEAGFQNAVFDERVVFNEARFSIARFRDELSRLEMYDAAEQFGDAVSLQGFTYDRLYVAWKGFFDRMDYDRQPYVRLEKSLRSGGEEEMADEVYYERRRIEGNRLRLHLTRPTTCLRWFWDRSFRILAGYGVRIWPLALAILLIVFAVLPCVFRQAGSVVGKAEARGSLPVCGQLGWSEAFGVGFRALTGIEVASGSQCVPSQKPLRLGRYRVEMSYSSFATSLRILGVVLLPYVAASLLGRVRGRALSQ